MVSAGGYILKPREDRRAVLKAGSAHESWLSGSVSSVAEPVPKFEHSRRAPLVVFISFEDGKLTHIADGRKGVAAGTGLVRLNLRDMQELTRPITFRELEDGVAKNVRTHLRRILGDGGLLPPKTLGAVVDCILKLDKSLASRLQRYSDRRYEALKRYKPRERDNLAFQKESLGIALDIADIPRDDLLNWQPSEGDQQSFLDGLPGAIVREDVMLLRDFSRIPGFDSIAEATHIGSKTFEHEENPSVRLTVIMANRLPLERQTGADLIYYNEFFRAFVMVQYKAMERRADASEFRWQNGDQFTQEIRRMENLLSDLRGIASGDHPDGFRFTDNPFFLKFCPRVVFNPDDKGLFSGIYLPLDLFNRLAASGRLKGERGGNLLTFENVGRRINNSEFVSLVANSWVGTSIEQSQILGAAIRQALSTGKTVTLAIKQIIPHPSPDPAEFFGDLPTSSGGDTGGSSAGGGSDLFGD